jgi:ankyrin repeat protein
VRHAGIVQLLLQHGAVAGRVAEDDEPGATPFVAACTGGHAESARLLLAARGEAPRPEELAMCVAQKEFRRVLGVVLTSGVPPERVLCMPDCSYGVLRALVVEHGLVRAPVDGDRDECRAFLEWWLEGTHPLQAQRRAVEDAVLAACPAMPQAVAAVLGQFVCVAW